MKFPLVLIALSQADIENCPGFIPFRAATWIESARTADADSAQLSQRHAGTRHGVEPLGRRPREARRDKGYR